MIRTEAVDAYLDGARPAPDPLLAEMLAHAARDRVPVVEPPTFELLGVLARATGARRAVEVGTAIGVSTLALARALPPAGRVVTFEVDRERQAAARDYLARDGVLERVELRLQDAGEGLRGLPAAAFDLAFLDGPKGLYADHLEAALALLRPGGLLVVDNVLMSGAVASGSAQAQWSAEHVAAQRAFNARLLADERLGAATLAPVGDGVALGVKR
jgi:O-methyltransferase